MRKILSANNQLIHRNIMIDAILVFIAFGLLLCSTSIASDVPEVSAKFYLSHSSIIPGGEFFVLAEYSIPKQTHLTENFLGIALMESLHFESGMLQLSNGIYEKDEIIRRGTAYLKLPVHVSSDAKLGTYFIKGSASYQICSEGETLTCYPPKDIEFKKKLSIVVNAGETVENKKVMEIAASFQVQKETKPLDIRLKEALSEGSLAAFIIVFIGGFLTSLTPCVYPMIPLTIGYIGAKSTDGGKSRGFILSLFYVLGLAMIYSFLGVLAAMTGSLFGSITQTPLVIGFVATIFIVMGISMLGVFDIALPSSLTSRLQSGGPRKGFGGAIIMGMITGLVAAPCAGPVIIVLLAFIASSKNVVFGFSLMMVFAFGMGLLFIALGTFSGLLTSLPQAGVWMDKIKKTFGIIMLFAGLWIVHPIMPPPLFGIVIGIGLVLLGSVFGAFDRLDASVNISSKMKKGVGILMVASGVYLVVSLMPVPGKVVPEMRTTDLEAGVGKTDFWRNDLSNALSDAGKQKKKVILDFTAKWCAACKELEHKTFSQSDVQDKLKDMIAVKIDCTDSRSPNVKKIQKQYNIKGLPTVIILNPEGEEISRIVSFLPPEQFIEFVNKTNNI